VRTLLFVATLCWRGGSATAMLLPRRTVRTSVLPSSPPTIVHFPGQAERVAVSAVRFVDVAWHYRLATGRRGAATCGWTSALRTLAAEHCAAAPAFGLRVCFAAWAAPVPACYKRRRLPGSRRISSCCSAAALPRYPTSTRRTALLHLTAAFFWRSPPGMAASALPSAARLVVRHPFLSNNSIATNAILGFFGAWGFAGAFSAACVPVTFGNAITCDTATPYYYILLVSVAYLFHHLLSAGDGLDNTSASRCDFSRCLYFCWCKSSYLQALAKKAVLLPV